MAAVPSTAATMASTYLSKYTNTPDVLAGVYDTLYSRYDTADDAQTCRAAPEGEARPQLVTHA